MTRESIMEAYNTRRYAQVSWSDHVGARMRYDEVTQSGHPLAMTSFCPKAVRLQPVAEAGWSMGRRSQMSFGGVAQGLLKSVVVAEVCWCFPALR